MAQFGKSTLERICRREIVGGERNRFLGSIVDHQIATSNGQFFRKNLNSHFGCVNAIEFSKDGEWMCSG
jgi:hypothetical protein